MEDTKQPTHFTDEPSGDNGLGAFTEGPRPLGRRLGSRKTLGYIIIAVLAIAAIGGVATFIVVRNHSHQINDGINPASVPKSVSDACTTTRPPFTQYPVALSDISTITPLGHLDPPSHDFPVPHMYVNYKQAANGVLPTINISSPGDITINQIELMAKVDDTNSGKTLYDYKVYFTACDQLLSGYFIHLYALSPKLAAAFGPIDTTRASQNVNGHETWGSGIHVTDEGYNQDVDLSLHAGDALGSAGGDASFTDNFDFGLSDVRVSSYTADPVIWSNFDNYYVCSLDYFIPSIKSSLYGKIGDFNSLSPAADQQCGQVYQDKIGTAQGVWLTSGTTTNKQTVWSLNAHVVSFIKDNIHQQGGMVGFSNDVQNALGFPDTQAYLVTFQQDSHVNAQFTDITSGSGVYCYTTVPQYSTPGQAGISFLLQMTGSGLKFGTLKPDESCASGSGWQFGKYLLLNR